MADHEREEGLGTDGATVAELAADPGGTFHLSAAEAERLRQAGEAEHQLWWDVQKGRDQAAPVLYHRAVHKDELGEVFVERRFYSAYDYDALQITAGILPLAEGGCAIFYVNRTYTSQVAGFGGSAKRSIGRGFLETEVVAELTRIQSALTGR